MNPETQLNPPATGPATPLPLPPTPLSWRIGIGLSIVLLPLLAYLSGLAPRGRAAVGIVVFIGIIALFSANLRAVNWRTVVWGLALQIGLAVFILKVGWWRDVPPEQRHARHAAALLSSGSQGPLSAATTLLAEPPERYYFRPGYEAFNLVAGVVKRFLQFTDAGSKFVFGPLADGDAMEKAFGKDNRFVFAFSALPTIIFVSSFFTVLYYYGVLQFIVRVLARAMMYLMRTSGAETLSSVANVFMGQTEAPLIVKPFVPRMTQSELLALMVGGMATISGGVMAVYIQLGADPVAILTTSVMAAPCGLYLSKLLLPEMDQPATSGRAEVAVERTHRNAIDAAAGGASDGLALALNVAAMLIAFLAFLALVNYLLGLVPMAWFRTNLGLSGLPDRLSLKVVFAGLFAPLAFLMGVETRDIPAVADLLGTKLVANEFVAYLTLTNTGPEGYRNVLSPRGYALATFALTGFANVASIGIQIGGIGAMAPQRRPDLARLGVRALLAGFLATLVNASLAGLLLD